MTSKQLQPLLLFPGMTGHFINSHGKSQRATITRVWSNCCVDLVTEDGFCPSAVPVPRNVTSGAPVPTGYFFSPYLVQNYDLAASFKAPTIEVREYHDGTLAAGKAPLPEQSPSDVDELNTAFWRWYSRSCPPGLADAVRQLWLESSDYAEVISNVVAGVADQEALMRDQLTTGMSISVGGQRIDPGEVFEPQPETEAWREAMRRLVFAARTSGGTIGPDADLMAACDVAEAVLAGEVKSCKGDPLECEFHGACMYACGSEPQMAAWENPQQTQAKPSETQPVSVDGLNPSARVRAAIASEWHIVAADGVPHDDFHAPVPAGHPLCRAHLCLLILQDGTPVVGTAYCADPERYDENTGRRLALEDAMNQVRQVLLGFPLPAHA